MLLTDPAEKMNSVNLLRYMAPIAAAVLLPATLILEPGVFMQVFQSRNETSFLAFLALSAALAYFVNLLNFLVTQYTSALTLQVLGNGKGVAAVFVSIMLFRNPITFVGLAGYLTTVSGMMLYMMSTRAALKVVQPTLQENNAAVPC